MYVLIVGGGKLGLTAADEALSSGHEVTLVEKDEEHARELSESNPPYRLLEGDGNEPAVLEKAEISRATAVLALTGDDEDNLVVCLLAKREYGVPLTAGRVNDVRNEWLFDARFGVDVAISATHLAADLLADRLRSFATGAEE